VLIEDEDVVAPRPKMTPSWNHFFGTKIFGDSRKDSLLQKAKSKKKEYMSTKKAYANVNLKSCHCKVS
jgi:hypothetical protein